MKYILCLVMLGLFGCNRLPKQAMRQLPFYSTADFTPYWADKSSLSYKTIHQVPTFSFVNQDSNIVTEKTIENKIVVANFFFTSCPGICKQLTQNLSLVQTEFEKDNDVLILSHSVTPEQDDTNVLKLYAKRFGILSQKWHLLTGNRDSIYTIARKGYFADEDLGLKKNSSDFLHTENILLLDKSRRIRGVYKGTSVIEVKNLIDDIHVLEQEK